MSMDAVKLIIGICCVGGSFCITSNGPNDPTKIGLELPPVAELIDRILETAKQFTGKQEGNPAVAPMQPADTEDESEPAVFYRIRDPENDPASQINAYSNLDYAIAQCPAGYCIFDAAGNLQYSTVT